MKHRFKNRVMSLVLSVCMMMPIMTQAMPVYSVDEEVETLGAFTTPFTEQTPITLPDNTTTTSKSYRIPSMVTLNDGTIVAATDIRWNTTYDGGGLDTLVACSTDGGANWDYTLANYLGDNGNAYNAQSTTFIDPSLLVGADGQTVYMLVDLYAGGVALNGNGSQKLPSTDIGFDDDGHLLLSSNSRASYDFYLNGAEIIEISTQTAVDGVTVDEYFNVTYTENGEVKYTSNLFFADSPYKVAQTGYLYLIKSTDGGASWSAPTLLNLKQSGEQVCLVAPGHGITTSKDIMVFPVYGYYGNAESQRMGIVYSDDGGITWKRSDDFTYTSNESVFSSEATVVELNNGTGTLRFFYRNDSKELKYADCSYDSLSEEWVWSAEQSAGVSINSDTQLSAITYSKTIDGKQVILVSCPTGPNCEGSNDNNGSERINGKVFVFVVENSGSMTLMNSINLFDTASDRLPKVDGQDIFDENTTFFAYSTLTERADGSVALLYENSQHGWGATSDTYFTITGKDINLAEELLNTEARLDIPQLSGLINMKVRFLPEYQNETATVPYLYQTPGYQPTALTDVRVYDLPAVMKIADTYHTSADNVYFELVGDNGEDFPDEYYDHRWVSAEHLEAITINYTEAAPFGEPVVGQSMAVFARNAVMFAAGNSRASDTPLVDQDGVVTSKTVISTGNTDEYKVTLEAHVLGNKTITTVTKEVATDIVLVLDQSGSMATDDFKTITGYQLTSGEASNFVDSDLYVEVGNDEYVKVEVEPSYRYSQVSKTNWEYYSNSSNLYYQSGDNYYKVSVTRSWYLGNRIYTYTYTDADNRTQTLLTSYGSDTPPDITLYERTIDQYVFSYVDANGVTQSETFGSNTNITPNKYYTATTSTITRLRALKNAVTGFIESVHEKAIGNPDNPNDDVNHRIAMVGFGRYKSGSSYYTNTELLIGSSQYGYNNYSSNGSGNADSAQSHYDDVFQNMNTEAGYNNVIASKNALAAEGGTYVNLGLEMANGIFEANPIPSGQERNRVVIVFTDGDPGYNGDWDGNTYGSSGDAEAVADRAIANATTSKTTYGATVYTIGIFNGADAETRPISGLSNGNKFMHYMSNNYTGGTSFDNPGTESFPASGSYYLSANNADDLAGIFKMISDNVEGGGSSVNLDETTVVRDIVSPNFVVPAGADGVSFYTANYIGENKWSDREDATGVSATERTENGTTTLDVSGFDFAANYVGTVVENDVVKEYRGKKLIIEFVIKVDPDFLGGSGVDTNGSESGIYTAEDVLVENFRRPTVDVPLKQISTVVQDKNIYVSNTTDLTGLLDLYVKRDDLNQNLQVTVDGVNNAYVDLEYTITLNENTVATYFIPAGSPWSDGEWTTQNGQLLQNYLAKEDTSFSVTCVMSDVKNPSDLSQPSTTAPGSATIYVYKPVVTFKDVAGKEPNKDSVNYGQPGNAGDNYVSVVWKHGDTVASNMEGTAPTLTFTYQPDDGCVDANGLIITYDDFHVNVIKVVTDKGTVLYNDNDPDVPDNIVTFVHDNWDGSCGFDPNKGEFMIHMKKVLTSLTIQKKGWQDVDPNQSFLFRVTDVDDPSVALDLTVTVVGDGSTTITGLRVGKTYQVVEITDWSWRYTNQGVDNTTTDATTATVTTTVVANGAEVILNAADADNVITFANERTNQYWLDGDSYCENWWGGNDGAYIVKRNGQNDIVTEENS